MRGVLFARRSIVDGQANLGLLQVVQDGTRDHHRQGAAVSRPNGLADCRVPARQPRLRTRTFPAYLNRSLRAPRQRLRIDCRRGGPSWKPSSADDRANAAQSKSHRLASARFHPGGARMRAARRTSPPADRAPVAPARRVPGRLKPVIEAPCARTAGCVSRPCGNAGIGLHGRRQSHFSSV